MKRCLRPVLEAKALVRLFIFVLAVIGASQATLLAQLVGQLTTPNPNNYDNAKIMAAIRRPGTDLVVLAAHRGTHALAGTTQAGGVPENSLQSIGEAAQAGWEAIEIDVKLTSDGIPILSHDSTWGRETCTYGSYGDGVSFDPLIPAGQNSANDKKNAAVSALELARTRYYFSDNFTLRDSVSVLNGNNGFYTRGCSNTGHSIFTGEFAPTLQDVYDYIRNNHIQMVVELDIKDAATSGVAWQVVQANKDDRGRSASAWTIFKVPAIAFPKANDFFNTFGANFSQVKFNPVFHTAGIAQPQVGVADVEEGDIAETATASFGSEANMNAWIDTYLQYGTIDIVAIEVSMKEPASTPDGGILASVRDHVTGLGLPISQFHSVPEYYVKGDLSRGQYFRSNNGECCYEQEEYLYNNRDKQGPFGHPYDHDDHRSDKSFLVNDNEAVMVTTDRPDDFADYLTSLGRRNTQRYVADSSTPPVTTSSSTPRPLTLTTLTDSAQQGGSVKLTALVYPANAAGQITFYDNSSQIARVGVERGKSVLTVSSLTSGQHIYYAVYGDPDSEGAVKSNSVFFSVSNGDRGQISNDEAALLSAMQGVSHATWLPGGTPTATASTIAQALASYNRGDLPMEPDPHPIPPTFTLYNIPFRDCGSYSAGGASNTQDYEAWVDAIASAVGNTQVIFLVEPDSLAAVPTDCKTNPQGVDLQQATEDRFTQIQYAVSKLKSLPNAQVYLDGGHSHYQAVPTQAERLVKAGVSQADGFFSNVSAYNGDDFETHYDYWVAECIAFGQSKSNGGWRLGHYSYCASQYYAQLTNSDGSITKYKIDPTNLTTWNPSDTWFKNNMGDAVVKTHYIIDTSRSGLGRFNGDYLSDAPFNQPASVVSTINSGAWCNSPARGLGTRPTTTPNTAPLLDAFLWVKTVGLSDGPCAITGGARAWDYSAYSEAGWPTDQAGRSTFDPLWGTRDPDAGRWFLQQALDLANNANPSLQPASSDYPPSSDDTPDDPTTGNSKTTFCAWEGNTCYFLGTAQVYFNVPGTTKTATISAPGNIICKAAAFPADQNYPAKDTDTSRRACFYTKPQ